jgi:hypothetical protein
MGWTTTTASILDRRGEFVQNVSQKSPSSARDFCNSYLFEKAWIKFTCECLKFRTVAYDRIPFHSDAWAAFIEKVHHMTLTRRALVLAGPAALAGSAISAHADGGAAAAVAPAQARRFVIDTICWRP